MKAGAPLNIALNGSDPDNDFSELLFFDVTTTVTTGNPQLTATVVEQFPYPGRMNQSLRISVDTPDHSIQGDMVFQLFEEWAPKTTARIIDLARIPLEDGKFFYEDLTFHRVAFSPDGSPFVIQGGDPAGDGTGGSGVDFDDEFHPRLQFTSPGVLAMAKSSDPYGNSIDDTNDSQFFITAADTRFLDFNYSIFGFLTQGENIRQQIQAIPDNNNDGKPDILVTMAEVDVFLDEQNCVLNLSAPNGFTGEADVTVTVSDRDPDSQPFSRTFHVKVEADTTNNNPFLESISPIETTANTPVTFTLPATDVEGDAIYYAGMVDPSNTNLSITVNSANGQTTVTPAAGFAGVASILVGVRAPSGSEWDTQEVPVYVKPAAPTVQLLASTDTGSNSSDGITNLNNTAGKLLSFRVLGTVEGAEVTLYADGTVIGRGEASGDTLNLYTNGTAPLTDASHAITATQTLLDRAVNVGNLHKRVDLASAPSATVTITVDTLAPQFTSTPVLAASEGESYAYDAQTNEEAGGGVVYQLTTSPGGMVINTQTGMVGWNPLPDQVPSQAVTIGATDKAGNVTEQTFRVQVRLVNGPPTANSQSLTVPSDGSRLITLTGSDGDVEVAQTLTFAIGTPPGQGTLTPVSTTIDMATYRYTPTPGYLGPDSFTFTVTDDATAGDPANQTSGPATVSLNVVSVNHSPTANPQSRTLSEDASIVITLTGDDGEAAIVQTLTFQVAQSPAHGTLSNFNDNAGTVTYTPTANYNGSDFFSFRVIDDAQAGDPASLASETAVVSLSITPLNDAPAATAQALTVTQNVAQVITLAGADNDPEVVQGLTFQIVTGPTHGTLSPVNQTTRQVTYTPAADSSGPDSFTFTVTDDAAAGGPGPLGSTAATVSINVNAVNAPPVANAQNATTAEDTTIELTLTGDDRDAEVTQTLRFNLVQGPIHGTITSFNPATGAVTYRPAPDYNGPDSIRFTVTDDAAAGAPASLTSAPATVSIEVTPVPDAPRFAAIGPQTVLQGQTLRLAVVAFNPDGPASLLRYSLDPPFPDGASIQSRTGELIWEVPEQFPAGLAVLKVRATQRLMASPPPESEASPGEDAGITAVLAIPVEVIDFRLALFASLDLGRPGPADILPAPDPLTVPSLLALSTTPGPIAPVVPLPGFGSAGLGDQPGWLLRATFSSSQFSPDMGYGLGQGSGPAVEPEGEKRPAPPPAEQPKAEEGAPTPGTPRRGDRSESSDDANKPRSRAALPDRRSEPEPPRQLNDLVLESLDDARALRLALTDPVEPMPIVQDEETVSTAAATEEPAGPWLAAALEELEAWVAAVVETAVGGS